MKKVRIRPRNVAALELRLNPQFRKQVVRMKTAYTRKGKHRHQLEQDGGHYWTRNLERL